MNNKTPEERWAEINSTTNNKSECCMECSFFMRNKHNFCVESSCPCHIGDSLRKQEEKIISTGCTCPIIGMQTLHKSTCQFTPKVATSEKECKHEIESNMCEPYCRKCLMRYPPEVTPHESEDWEAELKTAIEIFKVDGLTNHQLFLYVKDISSKSYQLGREEQVKKYSDILILKDLALEKYQEALLSLAVQEIEKGKKELPKEKWEWEDGWNTGLDKAKEIISGLIKK